MAGKVPFLDLSGIHKGVSLIIHYALNPNLKILFVIHIIYIGYFLICYFIIKVEMI